MSRTGPHPYPPQSPEMEYAWGVCEDDDDLFSDREKAVTVAIETAERFDDDDPDLLHVTIWRFKRPCMPEWYLNALDKALVDEPIYFPDREESLSGEVFDRRTYEGEE